MRPRRLIAFISHPANQAAGSSYLRAHQMMEIMAADESANLSIVRSTTTAPFSDALLVFDKYATEHAADLVLAEARQRRNLVIADPVDGPFAPSVLNRFDGVIAASRRQELVYRASLAVPVAYVGHHVDPRLGKITPCGSFALYYFGELVHARYRQELDGTVIFVPVDTRNAFDVEWMKRLPEASAHFALRPQVPEDSHKPFTKGFVAAHCGVPVIVDARDCEARYFLPADYPYWTDAEDLAGVRAVIARMKDDFGTPRWNPATAMMRELRDACSAAAVAREFRAVLREFA
jgi:hypothetical protein